MQRILWQIWAMSYLIIKTNRKPEKRHSIDIVFLYCKVLFGGVRSKIIAVS